MVLCVFILSYLSRLIASALLGPLVPSQPGCDENNCSAKFSAASRWLWFSALARHHTLQLLAECGDDYKGFPKRLVAKSDTGRWIWDMACQLYESSKSRCQQDVCVRLQRMMRLRGFRRAHCQRFFTIGNGRSEIIAPEQPTRWDDRRAKGPPPRRDRPPTRALRRQEWCETPSFCCD
jgi:hypothetical protein